MTTYYFDTSALSKRYVQETGSAWVRAVLNPSAGHLLLTARITMVEIYSALARRKREGAVSAVVYGVTAQASALAANQALQDAQLPTLVFASADDRRRRTGFGKPQPPPLNSTD